MIQSMTGFASKAIVLTSPDGSFSNVTISLKSVNSRFFETNFRVPYQLSSLETELEKRLKRRLYRGHIYVSIQMANPGIFKGDVQPTLKVVDGYFNAINSIKSHYAIDEPVTLHHLLQLPNVFSIEDRGIDEAAKETIFNEIESLIDDLLKARSQEGASLLVDIEQRTDSMCAEIGVIESLALVLIEQQKVKINTVMQELHGQENVLADMRKNALFALLDKIDIHEEIIRFKSHIESIKKQLITTAPEKGKKLDFTLQELAREINTITAKCSDALIGSHAINIKVDIEKVREQIQNIV
ncbi:MAG: YicC family protein [Candidatus Dependentiae bacterium]|nr:YicC family protein [Candidatus Dependentiae bacterium]